MTFVIVGASLAAANAAETLRAEGYTGSITMIGDDPEPPYERPPLSKGYLLGNQERSSVFALPFAWYRENAVQLQLGERVEALDPLAHTVTLASGGTVHYSKLLLATGASPRRLEVPGSDSEHVAYLRDLRDSDRLKAALKPGLHVVIVGAGWIGLETAAAFASHGGQGVHPAARQHRDAAKGELQGRGQVSVVEMDELPLRRVLGDEVAVVFRDLHTDHGVKFHFGRSVGSITDQAVILDDGTSIPADLVVVGVGVSPNTALAEAAGLTVDNGVSVSSSLQTTSPDVFACGDVAGWWHPTIGARVRVEHWENARQSGQAAARSMLGMPVVYDWVPYFFSDQYDLGMEYSGYVVPGGYDSVVFRGDVAAREFLAFWVREGRVLAGMNVNVWDVHDRIRELVTAGLSGQAIDLDQELPTL